MNADHVLIRGHVFTYAEKAPFMPSGASVLGALEYDEATDRTKCHECGTFQSMLGKHIKTHTLGRVDYNQRHGLRNKTKLTGPKKLQSMKETGLATRRANGTTGWAGGRSSPTTNRSSHAAIFSPDSHNEARNERNRCTAQLIYRIQVTAAQIGHTPSATDLRAAGVRVEVVERRFGNLTRAMMAAGLNPNATGRPAGTEDRRKNLPENFPTIAEIKRRWNERMPWPSEYFSAADIALEQRPK
jgi:hypothetical protein